MNWLSLFIIIFSSQILLAEKDLSISYDKSGFVTCYSNTQNTYFFIWDHFIKTANRNVSYIDINAYVKATNHQIQSCADVDYLRELPSEYYKNLEEIKNILPPNVLLSLQEIADGARLFHIEKSPEEYIQNRPEIFKKDSQEVLSQLRFEAGESFAESVMAFWLNKQFSSDTSCSELIGTCDFYLCQEKLNPCGINGYNLNYGYKYCSGSKFKLINEMKTAAGKKWVVDVFTCLQDRSFEDSKNLNTNENICSDIKRIAFSTHPDCYAKAGFCKLKLSEKINIFNLIKKEIFTKDSFTQGVELLKDCRELK